VWACGRAGGLGWADGEGEGDWKVQVKELVDVLKKVIQRYVCRVVGYSKKLCGKLMQWLWEIRYKYLQKPLEENALPGILQ
jgi:hypothetical protein